MIQRLHKLSPFLSFMFVHYSGNLIVDLLQGGRGLDLDHIVVSHFPISLVEPTLY